MKRITLVMLVCLATLCSYGQQSLELKIKKSSDLPITAQEHLYLIEITNISNSPKDFTIVTSDQVCNGIAQNKQIHLKRQVLNSQKTQTIESGTVGANSSLDFFVKISRDATTPLGKWNCTEVKVLSGNNNNISNSLIIKSLVPDPQNFN
ncbi:hypothetical protein SAMN04515667_1840 [Formosa sp. Hel1_31_208]|uniref:hypothetical protein n=1 Tax=Formosa sp. Hel1_31_208 TaxID=1798225 RepID=UPI00087D604C|nr:hypothetical protein [Formosa sp. Hel1_31_208]SDS28996.1 hypothetical protein SAMN04515667_1840 [Formosa sp. Hel1_31_208]